LLRQRRRVIGGGVGLAADGLAAGLQHDAALAQCGQHRAAPDE